ncbi:stage II sporulation protein [Salipaludibacillus neizhouensis]|uniref:Stage II sporulation protein n=1 Tax=Salipaludibacillus neizhouensis TaxID=885475 RepID=A0A3A9KEG4_9BACI|nr:M23 family metallopeptidase [Salipaludibacillus neizhouensis]RKL68023.1 stage II sporulation protein [Salipaludibacillus neizhouensis]
MNNHDEKQASKWGRMQAKMKRLAKKRWMLPALYLGLSAVVLTTFLWMTSTTDLTDEQRDSEFDIENIGGHQEEGSPEELADENTGDPQAEEEEAVPVVAQDEVFELPVMDENEVAVVGTFHDYEASVEEQETALVRYNNYFYQNKGIDLAKEDGEAFDVTASMSGTIVKAEEDALFGQVVHVEHDEDILSIYQSLDELKVEVGQTVKQGDVLGEAGRSLYNQDAGIHTHFEIRKDGVPVNPIDFVDQGISALPNVSAEEADEQIEPESLPDPEEDTEDSGNEKDSENDEEPADKEDPKKDPEKDPELDS